MKYLLLLIPFATYSFPTKKLDKAQMQVFQMDKDADISQLKAPKSYLKDNKKKNENISVVKGHFLLKRILNKEELKTMTVLDKDILIKAALNYNEADLIKKYKNKINKKKLLKIKEAIRNVK